MLIWNLKSQTIEDGTFTGPIQGIQVTANYTAITKNINFTYTFSENPNKINFNGSYTVVVTISLLGQNQEEEQEVNTNISPIDSADWSLTNNTISSGENSELPVDMNIEEFSTNFSKKIELFEDSFSFTKKSLSYKRKRLGVLG